MGALIEVTNLTKQFKDIKAVDDLSFRVPEGEVYGFLGQNGAGKSTTIRMLCTLIKPSSGQIKIFGLDLLAHRKEILRDLGAIIERPDLYKYLTGLENLRIFAAMSGVRATHQEYMKQLEMVGLADRAHSKVQTYSQGMKQRLGIATALIHNPRLIILDEPTNGLDPQGIADIRNLILHLSREMKKTVLVSSHLLSEMQLISDSMLIIDNGKKLVEGRVDDLFDPAETMVELKTGDDHRAIELLRASAVNQWLQPSEFGKIVLKIHRNQLSDLLKDLGQLHLDMISINARHSLEDYFLSLTSGTQHVEAFKN